MTPSFFRGSLILFAVLLLLTACGQRSEITVHATDRGPTVIDIAHPNRYLLFPVNDQAPALLVTVEGDGQTSLRAEIRVDATQPQYTVALPLPEKAATARVTLSRSLPAEQLSGQLRTVRHLKAPDKEDAAPTFHYRPRHAWLGQTAGLVFLDGQAHYFYETNPYGRTRGNVSWGHAVSSDLLHWEERGAELLPDSLGEVWAGSCVVDHYSTFGAGQNALVAMYTASRWDGALHRQEQCLAYHPDGRGPLEKFATNPVLLTFDEIPFFNAPQVFRYKKGNIWNVTLACDTVIRIYSSTDLANWNLESTFGRLKGVPDVHYERGQLLQLPTDGKPQWVFLCAYTEATGTGLRYFIGDYDGRQFRPTQPLGQLSVNDAFTSPIVCQNMDERCLLFGVIDGEKTARVTSLPRELALHRSAEGLQLIMRPARETEQWRGASASLTGMSVENGEAAIETGTLTGPAEWVFQLSSDAARAGLEWSDEQGHLVSLTREFVGTTSALVVRINGEKTAIAPLPVTTSASSWQLFVDGDVIEAFVGDPAASLSFRLPCPIEHTHTSLCAEGGSARLERAAIYPLGAW